MPLPESASAPDRDEFLEWVAELSSLLGRAPTAELEQAVTAALGRVLEFFDADRCALLRKTGAMAAEVACLVKRGGSKTSPSSLDFSALFPSLHALVLQLRESAHFASLRDLPPRAEIDRVNLLRWGIHSGSLIPMTGPSGVGYVLAIASTGAMPTTPASHMRLLAGCLHAAMQRWDLEDAWRVERRRTRQFTRAALNASQRHLCIVDAAGRVVECSDRWPGVGAIAGAGSHPLLAGTSYFDAADSARGPRAALCRKVADGARAVLDGSLEEFAMESPPDGLAASEWFLSRVTGLVVDGQIFAAISHEDMTERMRSEQELRNLRAQHWHAERVTRTGLLIASLAHELSQPLAAILSNAQAGLRFLSGNPPDLDEFRTILKEIVADDKRAGEIIESLRLMLRRQKADRGVIDLADLAREVAAFLRSELVDRQVELELDCAPGCHALADRGQLQQVLVNLMMNAIEAMHSKPPRERTLRIGVHDTGVGEVQLSVRDSGVGITQEEFAKIFDAFWTTKSRGTGMGLAIARSIIESHGGRITVDSGDGSGATFIVGLPAAARGARAGLATGRIASDDPRQD
jgi:signal transduction histidine kinase